MNTKVADDLVKYTELLLAVSHKYKNETRHETALRYIREAEITSRKTMNKISEQVKKPPKTKDSENE